MTESEDVEYNLDSIFTAPPRPPSPPPTISTYLRAPRTRSRSPSRAPVGETDPEPSWTRLEIKLVGSHTLWGHYLWNAARAFGSYLDARTELYKNGNVLELGAGGGLPGLITALNGAKKVVLTDYPDPSLLDNLLENVTKNVPQPITSNITVLGYIWGKPVKDLLDAVDSTVNSSDAHGDPVFDLIILSDLIFNHSQHDALLQTCELVLRNTAREECLPTTGETGSPQSPPCVLVFFSHHRPHLAQRDMEFFSIARSRGWRCDKILTERFPPMFPEDPGDEEVRATVHGWRLTRS